MRLSRARAYVHHARTSCAREQLFLFPLCRNGLMDADPDPCHTLSAIYGPHEQHPNTEPLDTEPLDTHTANEQHR